MQHSNVRKGICAVNLKDVVLWKDNYSAAQKAIAQWPPKLAQICSIAKCGRVSVRLT